MVKNITSTRSLPWRLTNELANDVQLANLAKQPVTVPQHYDSITMITELAYYRTRIPSVVYVYHSASTTSTWITPFNPFHPLSLSVPFISCTVQYLGQLSLRLLPKSVPVVFTGRC